MYVYCAIAHQSRANFLKKSCLLLSMESITESDVGMSEYLGMHKGFSGILKMRYQDFLVNEIDEENRVLYFTSMLNDELVDNKIPKKVSSLS